MKTYLLALCTSAVACVTSLAGCEGEDTDGQTSVFWYVNDTDEPLEFSVFIERPGDGGVEATVSEMIAPLDSIALPEFSESGLSNPLSSRGDSTVLTSEAYGCRVYVRPAVTDVNNIPRDSGPYDASNYLRLMGAGGAAGEVAYSFYITDSVLVDADLCQ